MSPTSKGLRYHSVLIDVKLAAVTVLVIATAHFSYSKSYKSIILHDHTDISVKIILSYSYCTKALHITQKLKADLQYKKQNFICIT